MILQMIGAALGVVGGSIFLQAPKRILPTAALLGSTGWAAYLFAHQSMDAITSTFISGLVITSLSHILARLFKMPVTIYLIPGVLPLVPGVALYQTVAEFIKGSYKADAYLRETFLIAGMIALSIFVVDSLVKALDRYTKNI